MLVSVLNRGALLLVADWGPLKMCATMVSLMRYLVVVEDLQILLKLLHREALEVSNTVSTQIKCLTKSRTSSLQVEQRSISSECG